MKVNNWKEHIDNSIAQLKEEQKRQDDLYNEINGALLEILKYDIDEMRKVRYDFFKDVTRLGVATPIYQDWCYKEIYKFVQNRREVYKQAFLNYDFGTIEPSVDVTCFRLDTQKYYIDDFITQAAQAFANEFVVK